MLLNQWQPFLVCFIIDDELVKLYIEPRLLIKIKKPVNNLITHWALRVELLLVRFELNDAYTIIEMSQ